MAKKVEIEVDVTGNIVESEKNLRALKKQLKELPAGTAEWNKVFNQIDDFNDKITSSKNKAGDWVDQLAAAPGPLGMLGKGLNSVKVATQSWGAALKATGIGLIVAAVGGLVAAFSQSETAMKKLEPLFIGLEKILGGIMTAVEPLFNMFIDLALKALPYVTAAIGGVYSAFSGFFTLIKSYALGVGKILKGIFTLDFDTLSEGVSDLTKMFGKAWDATKDTYSKFEEGTKKITKTEKENQKERNEAAQAALDAKIKRMEAEDKLDEAKLKKLKAEAMALATTEQEKLDVEKKFAELSYNVLLKDIEDKQKLYKKNSLEYKNLQTEKTNAEAAYTESLTGFKEKQAAIDKDAADKAKEVLKKKQEEERSIIAIGLEAQIADIDKKNALAELDFQQDLDRLKEKRALLDAAEANELANSELTEVQKTEIRQKYAAQRAGITQQEIATEKAAAEAKLAIQNAYLDAFAQLGGLLQQIAGKNKSLAIAGLVVEQAAGVAKIIVNTAAANAKSVAASPLTLGQPWVTINTISAGLSIASAIAATAKGIQQINSASSSGPSGGGAPPAQGLGQNYADGGLIGGRRHAQGGTMIEAEAGEAIMTRGAVTMFAPMLSMMNQMGGGTSFNKNAMVTLPDNPLVSNPAQEQNPLIMKTYVVENELTSMQQRQARLKDLSTL
jgi:hypothetical protein